MTKMWNENNSLYEVQRDIEKIILNRMGCNVRMGEVINFSFEDYNLIINRLDNIKNAEEFERYALTIITAWVVAHNYGKAEEFFEVFSEMFKNLPQHQTKYVLESLATTFYEYQIDNFGYRINTISKIKEIIIRHAGWK